MQKNFTRRIHQWCARHGVAPIEIVIVVLVLGALASLIVPPFSGAESGARDTAQKDAELRDALQLVRTQITVFKAQHREVPPGYPAGDTRQAADGTIFIEQLTEYSDQSCNISKTPSEQFTLGKYLEAIPPNPLTGSAAVWVTTAAAPTPPTPSPTPTPPTADESKPFGWIYNPQTLDFRPNLVGRDSRGIAYSDY